MTDKFRQYFRNWWLFLHFHWLWTRDYTHLLPLGKLPPVGSPLPPGITYKPGFGPWRFLPIYCTTYLLGVLCGHGVISISRSADGTTLGRWIDWVFENVFMQGPEHCKNAGPRLWGSKGIRG